MSASPRIRTANDSDLPFLLEGLEENRRGEGRATQDIPATPDDVQAFLEGIRKGWILIAEIEGVAQGFLSYRTDFPVLYMKGPIFWIDLVFVRADARGMDIGKSLYEEASSLAKSAGFSRIVLDVFDANTGSLAFHEKMGFHRVYGIFERNL